MISDSTSSTCSYARPWRRHIVTNSASQPPVYFRSLELENVRCIGQRQALSLADRDGNPIQWTLILGDNGVGKTTLLQCLAWMKPEVSEDENTGSKFLEPTLSTEENSTLTSLMRHGTDVQATVEATLKATFSVGRYFQSREGSANGRDITIGMTLLGSDGQLRHAQSYVPINPESMQPEHMHASNLVMFAYGAARRSGTLKVDRGTLHSPLASIFRDSAELYDAEDILLNLDYRAAKVATERNKNRLRQIKQVLASVLPDVGRGENIQILGPEILGHPSEPSGVRFKTPYGMVPLSGLSLGYQTTLTWIADLALRLYEQYPESPDPLSEPGIALIDEIELHLHPRWQRRMMEDLSRWFPNLQFIATAHSPLVVQAAEGGNLAILQERNGEASIEMHSESVSEWRADQILASDLFSIPSRSRSIEKLIEERDILLDMTDRKPDDEIRLRSLEKKLDTLRTAEDPDDQAAMDLIRKVAEKLKDGGWNRS